MVTRTLAALAVLSAMSCTHPRTLYISNKTGEPVTLLVATEHLKEVTPQGVSFKDSINGRQLSLGYTIINYGKGKWAAADKAHLKTVLSETKMVTGSGKTTALPQPKIKHYGWFVNELVFRITKPKQ